jgi:hypothetical protein
MYFYRYLISLKFIAIVVLFEVLFADVNSTSGTIRFNVNENSEQMILNQTGLGISMTPSSKLSVSGNVIITKTLSIGSNTASDNLFINGTMALKPVIFSSNTSLTSSLCFVDSFLGLLSMNLPAATSVKGRVITVKKLSADNDVWIWDEDGAAVSQGNYLRLNSSSMGSVKLISDGQQWILLSS